jgi:dipeptidyl aminopeptidase/acylaminoacyl peptidase
MPERAIEFLSAGSRLKGVFHDAGKGPAILCLHGLTLSHSMFQELGQKTEAEGLSLLRFHLRGHFDSEGSLEAQGFFDEIADASAAWDFMAGQSGVDPSRLGLLGFSLGGAVASMLSGQRQVKAFATWASLFDTSRWKQARVDQYGEAQRGIVRIWDGIGVSERLFSEAVGCNPYQEALQFPGPFFAAHGARDRNHPQEKSIELVAARKALGRQAEGFFPERSGHKFQVKEDWDRLQALSLDFFKRSL